MTSLGVDGQTLKTQISLINIPYVGVPTLWLGDEVKIKFRLIDRKKIEICRASGVQIFKVKWMVFDGAMLLPTDPQGSFIDLGYFGTYPSCEFQ